VRKIIDFTHATLDGYIDAPHEWSFPHAGEDLQSHLLEMTLAADALLLGRITYEGMAQAWPTRGGNPFADHVNAITKYIVRPADPKPTRRRSSLATHAVSTARRERREWMAPTRHARMAG
jgi:dihydrofolate reductase